MLVIEIDMGDVLKSADEADQIIRRGLSTGVELALVTGEMEATIRAPRKTGDLIKSIDSRVISRDTTQVEGEVFASAPHAEYVEEGTIPHEILPKRAQVLRWMEKGEARFAKRVSHPGTKPNPFMRRSARMVKSTLVESLERTAAEAVRKF